MHNLSLQAALPISCPARSAGAIEHFASRGALDIEGLGEQRVRQLIALGLVRDVADLYSIDWDVLRPLDGWGETSITNLRSALEASKQQPLWRLLVGLNIRQDRKSTRLNSSHSCASRMPSSA